MGDGDKVVFIEDKERVIMANVAKIAFANLRAGFAGEAERLGLQEEQDVVKLVDEVRVQMWKTAERVMLDPKCLR